MYLLKKNGGRNVENYGERENLKSEGDWKLNYEVNN